jgi:hypothetical protein
VHEEIKKIMLRGKKNFVLGGKLNQVGIVYGVN